MLAIERHKLVSKSTSPKSYNQSFISSSKALATSIKIFNYQTEPLNIYPWIILVGGGKNLGNNRLMRASISASGGYHCLVTFRTRFTGSWSWTPTGPRSRRSGPCKYIWKSWTKLKNQIQFDLKNATYVIFSEQMNSKRS